MSITQRSIYCNDLVYPFCSGETAGTTPSNDAQWEAARAPGVGGNQHVSNEENLVV